MTLHLQKPSNKKVFVVRLDGDDVKRIATIAKKKRVKKGALVRAVIQEWLSKLK